MREKELLNELAEMRRVFDEFFVSRNPLMTMSAPHWHPPMDVFDTPDFTIVQLEIAGMKKKDIEILLDGDRLILRGTRKNTQKEVAPPRCCRQMEIKYTAFQREVFLRGPIDEEGIEATYRNGFLEVRVPTKKVAPELKHVKINVKEGA